MDKHNTACVRVCVINAAHACDVTHRVMTSRGLMTFRDGSTHVRLSTANQQNSPVHLPITDGHVCGHKDPGESIVVEAVIFVVATVEGTSQHCIFTYWEFIAKFFQKSSV